MSSQKPKPKHPNEAHPSKAFNQALADRVRRKDPASSAALSSSLSSESSAMSVEPSKVSKPHPEFNPFANRADRDKEILRQCRKFLIAVHLYEAMCSYIVNRKPELGDICTTTTFNGALERPFLSDVGRAHFEFSKVMAKSIIEDLTCQCLPSLVAQRTLDDVEDLVSSFYDELEDDADLRSKDEASSIMSPRPPNV